MLPFKPPRLSVVAHSPRIPPGKQLNVPQPGFSPLYTITIIIIILSFISNTNSTKHVKLFYMIMNIVINNMKHTR